MTRRRMLEFGLGLCALLAAVDVIGLAGIGMEDAPPAALIVGSAILGVITLVALKRAKVGRRGGMAAVVWSRVLSALSGIPVYFAADAPAWAEVATGVLIALTAVALGLLHKARHEAYAPAAA